MRPSRRGGQWSPRTSAPSPHSDGLDDAEESEQETDPNSPNSDGDAYGDAYEVDRIDQDFDPLSEVRRSGVSDDAVVRLAARTDMKQVEGLARRARGVDADNGYYRTGFDAEIELRRRTGSQPREQAFPVDGAAAGDMTGGRKVDAWDPLTRTARESKSGYVIGARVPETLEQIRKDKALLDAGRVEELEWHFFSSAAGTVGADSRILQALDDAGIPYFLHLP